VLLGAAVLAATLASLGLAALFRGRPSGTGPEPAAGLPPAEQTNAAGSPVASANTGGHQPAVVSPGAGISNPVADSASTGLSGQLVASLTSLNPANAPLTPEKAAQWKQSLQTLVQQGGAAVPAIREFLARNTDVSFGSEAAAALGYGSVRGALIDALAQIGGPEATAAMLQTLQTTLDPAELAALAQDLDKLGPDQFRDQAVQAARQLLNAAATQAGLLSDKDAAPLFEVLEKYGGANVVPDLQRAAAQWTYYSAIALAQLPDGAGIPALLQMAQPQPGASAPSDPALRMLAELATQYPEARDALIEQARQNRIPASSWAAITPILAGDQVGFQYSAFDGTATSAGNNNLQSTHLAAGNQNFYSAPSLAGLTQDQISQQTSLIQSLLAVATDPAAIQALSNSSELLARRSSPSAAPLVPGH
jgi:hypothetical protein